MLRDPICSRHIKPIDKQRREGSSTHKDCGSGASGGAPQDPAIETNGKTEVPLCHRRV